jgi:endonuclease-3
MKAIDIKEIYTILQKYTVKLPVPVAELVEAQTKDPFKILITTILSARTKDETTAAVVRKLFKKVKNIKNLERISLEELTNLVYPVGFYKTKAKHLKKLPEVLHKEFGGEIPADVDLLTKLPGVGRKTANLVVALGFNKPAICVDIHVHRIMNRLGYVSTKTPYETEMKLREIMPTKYWIKMNHFLVAFGQHTCRPISPKCSICPLYNTCNRIGVERTR